MKLSLLTLSVCTQTTMSTDSITCYSWQYLGVQSGGHNACRVSLSNPANTVGISFLAGRWNHSSSAFFFYFYILGLIDFLKRLFEHSLLKLVPGSLPSRKPSNNCSILCRYGSAWFESLKKTHFHNDIFDQRLSTRERLTFISFLFFPLL